jgi:fatty-acyl-CoA synthase
VLKRQLIAQGASIGTGEALWQREIRGTAYATAPPSSGS